MIERIGMTERWSDVVTIEANDRENLETGLALGNILAAGDEFIARGIAEETGSLAIQHLDSTSSDVIKPENDRLLISPGNRQIALTGGIEADSIWPEALDSRSVAGKQARLVDSFVIEIAWLEGIFSRGGWVLNRCLCNTIFERRWIYNISHC